MRARMATPLAALLLLVPAAAPAGLLPDPDKALLEQQPDPYSSTGCLFEGVRYRPGQAVPVRDEPCVRCRCRRGAPVCRLRVCSPVPDPPPPGCVVLHRAHACCPQLHCQDPDNRLEVEARWRHGGHPAATSQRYRADGPGKGCYLNGSLFAEGSALSSSTLCDYCYCVRGEQRCVRPQCVLPAPGCTPEYRDHACCPTSYSCRASSTSASNGTAGTAPALAPPTPPRRRPAGCTVDGKRYQEGAQVRSVARGRCESCYCMRGRVRCAPLKCDVALEGCQPVSAPGKCCPVSYDCSKSRLSGTKTGSSASNNNVKELSGRPNKGDNTVRSISYDARSNREISSKDSKVKIETHRADQSVLQTTQLPLSEETTLLTGTADNIAITVNTKLDLGSPLDLLRVKNNTVIPEKSKILPVIEAIINKTRQKDQDYDYDYNEPSLPPSLPNLRIIPFVAEDAVIPEDKAHSDKGQDFSGSSKTKESQDKIDNFYFFSPPTETEGGFVPREPAVDGPFYQAKYDPNKHKGAQTVSSTKNHVPQVTIRTVVPEAVTPDPLLGNSGSAPCLSGGRRYRHGELLTGIGPCRMCFCFDGGLQCQEPSCGAVPPGCSRAPSKDPERCCGSIECGDESRDRPLMFANLAESETQRVPGEDEHAAEEHAAVESVPARAPVPVLAPTTTIATKGPSTSTFTTAAPTSSTTTTVTLPNSTTKAHRHRPAGAWSTTTTTSTTPTTTLSGTKTSSKPKTKPTTAKPIRTTRRPPSTTPRTTKNTTPTTPTRDNATVPLSLPTSPATPTTTTKAVTKQEKTTETSTSTSTTFSSTSPTTRPTSSSTTTPTPQTTDMKTITTTSTTTTTTTTKRPPLRKERPTTPTSLFDALWGGADESENEAQDKVDQDVQYDDLVSTNKHEHEPAREPRPPLEPEAEAEDDSFSFDKFLELFIQPDPTVAPTTPAPPRPATVTTPRSAATVSVSRTTLSPTTAATSVGGSSSSTTIASVSASSSSTMTTVASVSGPTPTAPAATTSRSEASTTTSKQQPLTPTPAPSASASKTTPTPNPLKKTSTAVPAKAKPSPVVKGPSPSKPVTSTVKPSTATARKPSSTTQKPTAFTSKAPTTTRKPAATTSRPPSKPPSRPATSATPRPTTSTSSTSATPPTRASNTANQTSIPKATTTTPSTTTTTAATESPSARPSTTTATPLATLRPSLLFGSVKHRPSMETSGSSSSYPAQLHHISTRRPPPAPASTPSSPGSGSESASGPPTAWPGLSGLLKLAGCNIYGRMYRVGKIIEELSGACLECRCTEVGVQCQQLDC
ncbi:Kielin/chordin-like protein [Frankliniella fusca]|uniref:Kielin/chordin-like protein n=1 Tax=Frankliniella fusca TaxID=407009 RepID=A0AAE1LCC0_9NEOP|nr:Kielin/chordin-like protein [Frankliniella fusca]